MCTCGIDIATQQATPATHSSTWAWFRRQAEGPRRRHRGRAALWPAAATAAGGRGRISSASSGIVSDAERRPGRCRSGASRRVSTKCCTIGGQIAPADVVAAGADRHRDAAPAHEPERGVGHQRRESGRAAEQPDQQAVREREADQMLAAMPARDEASAQAGGADQHRHHHAEAVGQPAHHDAADAEADHQQRVGQRGIGARDAELGLHRGQHDRRRCTCRCCRWSSAPA